MCGPCAPCRAGEIMPENPAEHWLTYRALGAGLRCTPNTARMHAHRRGWRRRAPNRVGDPARVLVPEGVVVQDRASHVAAQCDAQPNGAEQAHVHPHDLAHMRATEALREQLAIANRRIDELLHQLADAPERAPATDPMTAIGIQTL